MTAAASLKKFIEFYIPNNMSLYPPTFSPNREVDEMKYPQQGETDFPLGVYMSEAYKETYNDLPNILHEQ